MTRGALARLLAASAASLAVRSPAFAEAAAVETTWYARPVGERGLIAGVGARERRAAASLIKLLIAAVVVDDAARGVVRWNDRVRVGSRDVVDGSPTFARAAGRTASIDALLFAMLSQSDNTAANALLGLAGFARCNATARALGLKETVVERRFYDWAAQRRGRENRSSARDIGELLVRFARAADDAGTLTHDGAARVMRALYAQTDRETIPGALPDRRIANKTGELPAYRHDAAIVGAGPRRYVLVVMTHYRDARADAVAAIRRIARDVDARERALA